MNKIPAYVFMLFLIVSSQFVFADGQYSVVINGLSKHFDVDKDVYPNGLNELNLGLGAEYDFKKSENQNIQWILNGGFYRDSLNSTAVYFGGAGLVNIFKHESFHVDAGVDVSFFYSKEYNQGNPFIAPVPIINIGTDKVSLNITLIPKLQQIVNTSVVFIQLKIGI